MAMGIKCCKDCKKRFLGCHDSCATYKAELEELHKEKEYNKKQNCQRRYAQKQEEKRTQWTAQMVAQQQKESAQLGSI